MSGHLSTANRKRSQIYLSMLEVMPGTFGTLLRQMEMMRSVNLLHQSLEAWKRSLVLVVNKMTGPEERMERKQVQKGFHGQSL